MVSGSFLFLKNNELPATDKSTAVNEYCLCLSLLPVAIILNVWGWSVFFGRGCEREKMVLSDDLYCCLDMENKQR